MNDSPDRAVKIDWHAHFAERKAIDLGMPHSVLTGFGTRWVKPEPGSAHFKANEAIFDPYVHVANLDKLEIDAEVLSSITVMEPTSWAPPEQEAELNRRINEEAARWVRLFPDRFIGSFTLPLQDEEMALSELEYCVGELDLTIVHLPTCVNGTYLSEPEYRYLWDAIAEKDLIAFIHPDGVRDMWFQSFSMWNSVGQPIEEAKFLASLIYEGVLERLPQLKIVMAHGGGYLPHYFGRLDRNVAAHPPSAVNITRKPSEYLKQLYYDTCLYEPAMLEALIGRVGAERIVMGSDYPVGDPDPVGFIDRCGSLSPAQKAAVTGGTIADLLGLIPSDKLGIARRPSQKVSQAASATGA